MSGYTYGEEIRFKLSLLQPSDSQKIMQFTCGNQQLDRFIQKEIIVENEVNNEDGLIFKVENLDNDEIIGIVSLAANGIVFKMTNYMKVLPAVKIDVFAVAEKYQKMHYNEESRNAADPDDHFYLSDSILCNVIKHCYEISENYALVNYILLYADRNAYRFYQRNQFLDFENYMEQESNMEIRENIPMFMKLC